jgi:hypothetical protein
MAIVRHVRDWVAFSAAASTTSSSGAAQVFAGRAGHLKSGSVRRKLPDRISSAVPTRRAAQLVKLGFSRQSNRKADEGSKHWSATRSYGGGQDP